MTPYIKVAEKLLIDRIVSNKFPITRKSKVNIGLLALSCFFFIVGTGFLIYAAHIWFGNNFEPELAAALTGLVCFSLCVLSLAILALLAHYRRSEMEKNTQETIQQIQGFIDTANDEFGEPIQENPKTAVALATALGLAVGNRIL